MITPKRFWATATKFIIFFCLSVNLAYAKFMVEPFWNHSNGSITNNLGNKVNYTSDINGLNVGYLGQNIMAGVIMTLGRVGFSSDPTGDGDKHFKSGGVGTYLGFHFRGWIKAWTEYQNTSLEPGNNNDHRYYGQQVALGLGFRIYDGVLINYKYHNNYYTQIEDDITGQTNSLSPVLRSLGQSLGLSFIFVW